MMPHLKLQMCTTHYLLQVFSSCAKNEFKGRIVAEMMRGTLRWLYGLTRRETGPPHCFAVRV